jgi:secreted protein with Ig-like and vWFA domain
VRPTVVGRSQPVDKVMRIVEPDPSIDYSILRVKPDPNVEYSMIIIDPTTQKPPTTIDPNALEAIIDELKKRRQESIEK